jgi:hypothetical protein
MFRKMHASLICGSNLAAAALQLWLNGAAFGQSCGTTSEIISNNMVYLAGSGDTLWIASYRQGWGLNYTTDSGKSWWGSTLDCYANAAVTGISFGAGTLAAILNPSADALDQTAPTTVWHFTHAGSRSAAFTMSWPDSVRRDTAVTTHARNAVYAAGKFYFACGHGGLVSWDPVGDSLGGFLPGDSGSFVPSTFSRGQHPRFGTDTTAVLAADRFADSAVLAVTPPRLLLFDPARHTWDTGVTTALADMALHFKRFSAAFVNNAVRPPILYAYLFYRDTTFKDTALSLFSLFRYHTGRKQWTLFLRDAPNVVAPAVRGYLYVERGDNQVSIYRDSTADTVVVNPDSVKPAVGETDFDARLIRDIPKPKVISDMLFFRTGDSTGILSLVSSDGLFVSWNEVLGDSAVTGDFKLIRRSNVIKSGLAETYAVPGIITDDPDSRHADWTQATFVYKLSRDANVTIRIYDFNMHYVKSVIENAPRKAAAPLGRSTDSRCDVWDGTTASGRPVAPGVYYYKITASTGERSFGKIVVAKGQGN